MTATDPDRVAGVEWDERYGQLKQAWDERFESLES